MTMILENSGGPGSSVTLDPEIIELRNSYLKALEGKPFDEINVLIQNQLEQESDDTKRLALLAARVYLLRVRTLELRGESTDNVMPWSEKVDKNKKEKKPETDLQEETKETKEKEEQEWRRLRMIEAGEVNGVRFPPGIIIDVNKTDGDKLVESGKAEYIKDKEDEEKTPPLTEENKEEPEIKKDNNESSNDEKSENKKQIEDKAIDEKSAELTSVNEDDLTALSNALSDEEKKGTKEESKD
jgi:hypothetical protein